MTNAASVRTCIRCGVVRNITAFDKKPSKANPAHRRPVCNRCRRHKSPQPVVAVPKPRAERRRDEKRKVLEWLIAYRKTCSCSHCGNTDHRVLDFHHEDPSTKEAAVGEMAKRGSLPAVVREVLKCIPLCANCHRIHHWEMRRE